MVEIERVDDSIDIVRPELRLVVAFARLVRQSVTAHIHRYKSMVLGQARVHLATPLQPALRYAMYKEDRTAPGITRLDYMQLNVAASSNSVRAS